MRESISLRESAQGRVISVLAKRKPDFLKGGKVGMPKPRTGVWQCTQIAALSFIGAPQFKQSIFRFL